MTNDDSRAHREFTRFLKFSVVGALGFAIDSGLFVLLADILGLWSLAAQFLSFCAAVASNFYWNRVWVYPDSRAKPVRAQALQFLAVNAAGGVVIRTPFFAVAEGPLQRLAGNLFPSILTWPDPIRSLAARFGPTTLGSVATLVIAVILVLFWNFAVNRLWTYSDVR